MSSGLKSEEVKNYIIGVLSLCIVVLLSFMYKDSKTPLLEKFPVENKPAEISSGEPTLYLYIFFSKHNCPSCLEAVQVLNELPPPFVVTGIVPAEELKNETGLRRTTGAAFNLISSKERHKKFTPNYTPAIFGVAGNGKILFVLPGVPGEKKYLYNFLVNFYGKSSDLLIADGIKGNK